MEQEVKKSGRGGAREGAGRKRKSVRNFGFRISAEADAILSRVEGSRADYINRCIVVATEAGLV